MSESTTKIVLTVAVVGVLLYFAVKLTAPKVPGVVRAPSTSGPGTALNKAADIASFAASLGKDLGSLFGKTSNTAAAPVPASTTPAVASGFGGEMGLNSSGTDDPALAADGLSKDLGGDWDVLTD